MKRTQAAELLDRIRIMLAHRASPEMIEQYLHQRHGILPLEVCNGEAHQNAHIDHCVACSPRWGTVGEPIKIT